MARRDLGIIVGLLAIVSVASVGLWFVLGSAEDEAVEGAPRSDSSAAAPAVDDETAAGAARRRAATEDLGRRRFGIAEVDEAARTASISGFLVDAERGLDLAAGELFLVGPDDRAVATGSSANDGSFRLSVPPGPAYRLHARAEGLAGFPVALADLEEGEERDLGPILLYATNDLSGRVLDFEGRPVADATVELHAHRSIVEAGGLNLFGALASLFETVTPLLTTRSDEEGRYAFSGLPAGTFVLRGRAEGHGTVQSERLEVSARSTATRCDLRLETGAVLRGQVVAGEPLEGVAGVIVALLPQNGGVPDTILPEHCVTDEEGRFVFASLATREYQLFARAEGHAPSNVEIIRFEGGAVEKEVRIELPATARVEGRLRNAASGEPLGGVRIYGMSERSPAKLEATSDKDGRFLLSGAARGQDIFLFVQGRSWFADPADNEGIEIARGLGMVTLKKRQFDEQGVARVDLRLRGGAAVKGCVRQQESGAPVVGARVAVIPAGDFGPLAAIFGGRVPSTITDAEGRFDLDGVRPGSVLVVVQHETFAMDSDWVRRARDGKVEGRMATAGEVLDVGDLRLGRGRVIEGVVRDASGRTIAGAEVTAHQTYDGLWLESKFGTGAPPRVVSDASGRFRLGGLLPARELTLRARHAAFVGGGRVTVGAEATERVELVLRRGATLRLRVLDPDGLPLVGEVFGLAYEDGEDDRRSPFDLAGFRDLERRGRSDTAGRVVFPDLPPGTHRIERVRDEEQEEGEDRFLIPRSQVHQELVEGAEREVEIRLRRARRLPVLVLAPDGEPARRVRVRIRGDGVNRRRRTDAEGRVTFTGLEADGTYSVRVSAYRHEGGLCPEVLREGVPANGVELLVELRH